MNILYEADGGFKVAHILSEADTSLQIESDSGKRSKIKTSCVLLKFREPAPGALLQQASLQALDIDTAFLWECAPEGEFSFSDLAEDYCGHSPTAVEAVGLLLALQAAPIYFHRKGKGRFRKAPPEILQAALAGQERKRLQAEAQQRMVDQLLAGHLPEGFGALLGVLLYSPDRNRIETKALEAACEQRGISPAQLLGECGAFRSIHDYHYHRFLHDYFPKGTDFPPHARPVISDLLSDLPEAGVEAFSIDDAATTEIDDAFSVQALPGIGHRIGIHIAAPGLGLLPASDLDSIARQRLSTVYMPGHKITMLPEDVIEAYTLSEGRSCPALSLYLDINEHFDILGHESRIEQVKIAANLRHHEIDPVFNEQTLATHVPEFRFRDELKLLWQLAGACEARRGKPSAIQGVFDYNFHVSADPAAADQDPDALRVEISARRRGSPLDKLVSELMIVANATWGGLLAEKKVPGIYRAQTGGRVRMTTSPLPHEGLGVAQYAWSSSPLRRYVDLVNQWQLISLLRNEPPRFPPRSELLFSAMRDFDLTYSAYAELQRAMERYWCLRWLQQEGIGEIPAGALRRPGLFKLDHLPLMVSIPSAPSLTQGARILVKVGAIDFVALEADFRYLKTLEGEMDEEAVGIEEDDSVDQGDSPVEGEMGEVEEMTEISAVESQERAGVDTISP